MNDFKEGETIDWAIQNYLLNGVAWWLPPYNAISPGSGVWQASTYDENLDAMNGFDDKPKSIVCSCDIKDLMYRGCKCGAFKREQENEQ